MAAGPAPPAARSSSSATSPAAAAKTPTTASVGGNYRSSSNERTHVDDDHHTYANVHEVTFQHLEWTVELDFATQQLRGTAEYLFTYTATPGVAAAAAAPAVVVLDTLDLEIERVSVDNTPTQFELRAVPLDDAKRGRALIVPITAHARSVYITYATALTSSGLHWVAKEHTTGKTHPFVVSATAAAAARRLLPSPDTPDAQFTYTAHVTVPAWTTVLLSAVADESLRLQRPPQSHKRTITFHQRDRVPVSSIAIVAGRMESVEVSRLSRVWAEPSSLAAAALACRSLESIVQHAEAMTGHHLSIGQRCDVVCVPPAAALVAAVAHCSNRTRALSPPPMLVLVAPTGVERDAFELEGVLQAIATAWICSIVHPATPSDSWLCVAWTTWLTRQLEARVVNCTTDQQQELWEVRCAIGQRDLESAVTRLGATHTLTRLVSLDVAAANKALNADTVDAEMQAAAVVIREKSFALLRFVATRVTTDSSSSSNDAINALDTFARAFGANCRLQRISTSAFCAFVASFPSSSTPSQATTIDWDAWFFASGLSPEVASSPTKPLHTLPLATHATALAAQMASNFDPTTWRMESAWLSFSFSSLLWTMLLDALLLEQASSTHTRLFTPLHLDAIDAFVSRRFSSPSSNVEMRVRWSTLVLRAGDWRQLDTIVRFVWRLASSSSNRNSNTHVQLLVQELCKALGQRRAAAVLTKHERLMVSDDPHNVARSVVDRALHQAAAAAADRTTTQHAAIATLSTQSLGNINYKRLAHYALPATAIVIAATACAFAVVERRYRL